MRKLGLTIWTIAFSLCLSAQIKTIEITSDGKFINTELISVDEIDPDTLFLDTMQVKRNFYNNRQYFLNEIARLEVDKKMFERYIKLEDKKYKLFFNENLSSKYDLSISDKYTNVRINDAGKGWENYSLNKNKCLVGLKPKTCLFFLSEMQLEVRVSGKDAEVLYLRGKTFVSDNLKIRL